MRRLIRLAARLYPARWLERYGREFDALLDEADPRWQDVLNVLGAAMKMQITHWNFAKIVAVFAAGGALLATAIGLVAVPNKYVSSGAFLMHYTRDPSKSDLFIAWLQRKVLSRNSLSQVIRDQDLYKSERQSSPLEDVIVRMQRDITVSREAANALSIRFAYPSAAQAQRTVQDLMARMAAIDPGDYQPGLEVLDPASLSDQPIAPNRLLIALIGVAAGSALGSVIAMARKKFLFRPPPRESPS